MTRKELYRLEVLAERNKQFLDVLRFKIPRNNGMGIYKRMQAEVYLKNINNITDIVKDIETSNDIIYAKELIQALNTSPDENWREIVLYTLEMLDEMRNTMIFHRGAEFDFIKERVIHMLDIEVEEAIA